MIYLGADKHGYSAIKIVEEYLSKNKIEFVNLGVKNSTEDISLQKLIPLVVQKVKENSADKGILSCGTGIGVAVGANKFKGIRACLATSEKIAEWSVVYDNCNVLCLAGWEAKKDVIVKILNSWLSAAFAGDQPQLKMLQTFDEWK